MKKKYLLFFFIYVLSLLTFSSFASQGHHYNDISVLRDFKSKSSLKINVCYSYDKNFGLPKLTLENEIKRSLSLWTRYLLAQIYDYKFGGDKSTPPPILKAPKFIFSGETCYAKGLSIQFVFKGKGHLVYRDSFFSSKQYSLTRYYKEINQLQVALVPSGFYEEQGPHWRESQIFELQAHLLHELGHILGYGHKDGTIMSSDIWSLAKTRHHYESEVDSLKGIISLPLIQ